MTSSVTHSSYEEQIAALRKARDAIAHRSEVSVSSLHDALPREDDVTTISHSPLDQEEPPQEEEGDDNLIPELLEEHDQLQHDLRVLKSMHDWIIGVEQLLMQPSIPTSEKRLRVGQLQDRVLPAFEDLIMDTETHLNDIELEIRELDDAIHQQH